jgi:aryl-alcohol dehydrogenase-like predicted oxidoreductase
MYYQDDDFAIADRLSQVAKARGLPNMQVALAWLLSKPGISAPIIGASKMPHLEEALAALSVKLTEGELKQLEELYKPHPILGHS